MSEPVQKLAERFRGYLPVVVDLETGGFDHHTNPVLELACAFVGLQDGMLVPTVQHCWQVVPFAGARIDPASLKVTGIDPSDPSRNQQFEKDVLNEFFKLVRDTMKDEGCQRAILVAHNAAFDHGFINAACERTGIKRNPFHPFSTLDTATIAAVAYGHTVLSQACKRAGLEFDASLAHSAAYDAERTAALFCRVVNAWDYAPVMD